MNKHGREAVRDSLEGNVGQAEINFLRQYMEDLEMHQAQKETCLEEIVNLCKKHYNKAFLLLQSIPAIKEQSAAIIISEIGTDMSLFATAAALVSWTGLRPRNDESAGKIKSRKITHGNKNLRKALMEVAWGASRTCGSIARHLLVIIWSLLSKDEYFDSQYMLKVGA